MNNLIKKLDSARKKFLPSKKEKQESTKIFEKRVNMYKQFLSPDNNLCFDVGANRGNRIEPLLYLNAKIVAIEPQKKCYNYLKRKFKKKIILVTKGLGEYAKKNIYH
jgi:16S rRNA A1518/A1519 N6-dimethyltransferase RsmA/KsgA/DIM1 with predicted DNA glycosylase/AP lyase activity